ncbi:heterokaryon incompatibility protein-domain-containing protein [Paraphoma chrysanthemicola]|nr:heterokaryon incompatibility protein-domain-containing protein [Paraphoma chrysanthemicola]
MEYFCTACTLLNISLTSFVSLPGTDNNKALETAAHPLGSLKNIRNKFKSCLVCRLIFASFRSGPLKRFTRIVDLDSVVVFAQWFNALGPGRAERLKSPSTGLLVWAEAPNIPTDTYKIVIRAVSSLLPQPHFGRISAVRTSFLDFPQITKWLSHCEKSHNGCATTIGSKPTRNFFVIDTRFKCIIEPKDSCRYLALSYVWGGVTQFMLREGNVDELKKRFSIQPRHLTTTVRDAIALTEKLGERYLWVDTLCIIQDSTAIRQQTLQDMGLIYAQAVLTIVAGSSSDANSPLLGVTEERSWTQWYQKISNTLTISAHFDFKDYLENAVYSSRAWTYQEYQLAKRLLIFAPNGQVYFACDRAVFSEEVVTGPALDADAAMVQGAQLIKVRPDPNRLWATYKHAAESYTARNLSHQGDVVDAFSGILHGISDGRCVEGIPVSVFEMALLWQPRERMLRRHDFASWAWVGWKGKISWLDDAHLVGDQRCGQIESDAFKIWRQSRGWIVWHSALGTSCRSQAFRVDGPPWLTGASPEKHVQEERFPGLSQHASATPFLLPDRFDTAPDRSLTSRYLQFWTVSLRFEIELETTAVLHYTSLEAENTGNGLRRFILRDSNAQDNGWVLLDERWIELVVGREIGAHEFILLSEARPRSSSDSSDMKRVGHVQREYHAMMITWRDGIAERAGLGQVVPSVQSMKEMEWKEILLG